MSYQSNLVIYGQQDTGKKTLSQLIPSTFEYISKNQDEKKYTIQLNKICIENVLQYNKQLQLIKMNKIPLAIIFTYSVADSQSFNFIKQQFELMNIDQESQIILLGTKTDLPREITLDQGKQLKQDMKAQIFYEIETKTKNSTLNDFITLLYRKLTKKMNENQEILEKCLINLDLLKKEQDNVQFSQIARQEQLKTQNKPLSIFIVHRDNYLYRQFVNKVLLGSETFKIKSEKYNLEFDTILTDKQDHDNYLCQILLYKLQIKEDFQFLQDYMQESHEYNVKQNVLLGVNSNDDQRIISLIEGKQFKQQIGALFYEVSLDEESMNWDLFIKNLQIKLVSAYRNIIEHQQLDKYTQNKQQNNELMQQSASQQILQEDEEIQQQQVVQYNTKQIHNEEYEPKQYQVKQIIQQKPKQQEQQMQYEQQEIQQQIQQQQINDIKQDQQQSMQQQEAQQIPDIELPHATLDQTSNFVAAMNSSDIYQQHSKVYNQYQHDLYNQTKTQDSFQVDSFVSKPSMQGMTGQQRLAQQIIDASKSNQLFNTQSRLQQKYHINIQGRPQQQIQAQSQYPIEPNDLMNNNQKLTATKSLIDAQRAMKKIQREKIVTKATAPLTESMKLTKQPVLVLELDINNKIYQLPLCKNDDFYVKAKEFVQKNELDSKMIKQIAMLSVERMNNYLEQEKQEYLQQKRSMYQTQKFYTPQFNRVRQIKEKQPPLFKFELEIGRRKAMIAVREENKDHPEILADQFIRITQVDRNQYYGIIVSKIQEMISLYEMQQDGIE